MSKKYIIMDIETTGLHRKKDIITYIGAYIPHLEKYIIFKPTYDKLLKLLNKIKSEGLKVVWHNGVFDTSFIQAQFDIIYPIDEDSMLMAHCIDSNSRKGLKYIATEEVGLEDWDIDLDTKLGNGDDNALKQYLKLDLLNTYKVFVYKKNQINSCNPKIKRVYRNIMIPGSDVIRQIQVNGVFINIDQLNIELALYQKDFDILQENIYYTLPDGFKEINLNSSKQLGLLFDYLEYPILSRTPSGARATGVNALKELKKSVDDPVLNYILDHRSLTKTLEFLNKWSDMQVDSRLYPSFNLTGTKTGRLSSSEPNLQQVPRNPRLRGLFTAPKGSQFVEADFSQVELRIAAHITRDREMLAAYNRGEDLHTATAKLFNENPTKEDRTKAKSMNFGLLYGMQAKTYRDYAENDYGLILTLQEATKIRNNFFKKYARLPIYHKATEKEVLEKGVLYSQFGRSRIFKDVFSNVWSKRSSAVRAAINFPVQSMASDILLGCMIQIHREFPHIKIVGTVHDSILLEVKKKEHLLQIKSLMENPKILKIFKINIEIPLIADVEYGKWGSK